MKIEVRFPNGIHWWDLECPFQDHREDYCNITCEKQDVCCLTERCPLRAGPVTVEAKVG